MYRVERVIGMSDFHFLRPLWLWALLPLGLLLWRLWRVDTDRDAWRDVIDRHLLPHLLVAGDGGAGHRPLVLLGLGWLLAVVALAGPTWERLSQPLYEARQFRVIVLDLSPSMNATDLAPSRLARARFEVLDLLRQSNEGQTALLAYGAEPFVVAPLTTDAATIAAQVPSLDTGLLPVQGPRRTDLALDSAVDLLRQAGAPDGQVILLTDGLDHGDAAVAAASRLRDGGYRLWILGMGTQSGGPVTGPDGSLLKDARGAIVVPSLDVDALKALAAAGGGRYVGATPDDRDIDALKQGAGVHSGEQSETQHLEADQWREGGPWLLALLLPLAALAFRRGWLGPLLLLVCMAPAPDAYAFDWAGLWQRPDQQAAGLLQRGQAGVAAQVFERPDWRAAAHYQASDYQQALQLLQDLPGPDNEYNRGNALAHLDRLDEALAAYDRVLASVPDHADARYNRDLVQRLLEQQQQQQQQQQGQEGSDADQGEQGGEGAQEQSGTDANGKPVARSAQQAGEPQQAGESDSGSDSSPSQQGDRQDAAGSGAPQQQTAGEADAASSQQGSQQAEAQDAGQARAADGQQGGPPGTGQDAGGPRVDSQPPGEAGSPGPQDQQQAADDAQDDAGHARTAPHQDPGQSQADAQAGQASAGVQDAAAQPRDQQVQTADSGTTDDTKGRRDGAAGDQDTGSMASNPGAQSQAPGLADLLGRKPQAAAGTAAATSTPGIDPEDRQAIEQLLRRVEDDPAGLLRQRFLLQHLRRTGQLP